MFWGYQLDLGICEFGGRSLMAIRIEWFDYKSLEDTVGVVGRLDVPRLLLPNNKPWLWICGWEIWILVTDKDIHSSFLTYNSSGQLTGWANR